MLGYDVPIWYFFFPGFGVLRVREIVGEQGEKENREAKTKKEKMD